MKFRLTPLQSRLAAIGLLILSSALIIGVVAIPTWWLNQRYDAYLDDYTDRLQRYARIAGLRSGIESASADLVQRNGRKYYLKGTSATLAAAELQSIVTRIVEANKGRIASSQVLPSKEKEEAKQGEPVKIQLQVQMQASMVPLQLILHAIETNEPSLFIERLVVSSHLGRNYRPEPGIQPEFSVQLTVSGYSLVEGGKT